MEVTIICDKLFYFDGTAYKTTGGFGKVIEGLSSFFNEITLCVPVKDIEYFKGYQITSANIKYYPLPYSKWLPITLIEVIKIARIVAKSEVVHCWIPSYKALVGFTFAKLLNKPLFTYVAGDWEWALHYWGLKDYKLLTKACAFLHLLFAKIMIYNSTSFLVGEAMYEKYYKNGKDMHLTSTSTLSEQDIIEYRDTCQNKQIKLLFVGRLSPEKAIPCLLNTIQILRDKGYGASLIIVGDGTEGEKITQAKTQLVELKGYVPIGEELSRVYQESDIFVFPSYENTVAKVVLEAMANGLPVVVSDCGAIPQELKNNRNCLLVKPDNGQAIANAVEKIINNDELRQTMIKNSLGAVRNYTLEKILEKRIGILKASDRRLADL